MRVPSPVVSREPADFPQRAADAVRIASELHRASVGKKLPLPRNGRLDQTPKENADVPQDPQRNAGEKQNGHRVSAAPTAASAPAAASYFEQQAAGNRDDQQPVQHADQPQVKPHVTVQHMRKLMRNHSLQFVA